MNKRLGVDDQVVEQMLRRDRDDNGGL